MWIRLRYWAGRLRSSFWFVPALMALGGLALAAVTLSLDMELQGGARAAPPGPWDAQTARAILATVAGSAITVAGVVFSITIVVLNMASAQFGPRLLPVFMAHGGTQLALGTFVGAFIFCLLVLGAVRGEPQPLVPQISVGAGMLFGVASFALLIYFVHHVSVFVQAPRIIDDVASALEASLDRHFPPRDAHDEPITPDEESGVAAEQERAVTAPCSGYLQLIDETSLLAVGVGRDLQISLDVRPGKFVTRGTALARVGPAARVDEDVVARIVASFVFGSQRTDIQDPELAVHRLVEIALRALSPGINDPFTAINCIDRLGAALAVLAGRRLPSRYRRDASGRVRLVAVPFTYAGMVEAAFDQIRQCAHADAAVIFRLLEVIAAVAVLDVPDAYRRALRAQADAIFELSGNRFATPRDRMDFESRYRAALRALSRIQ